MEENMKIEAWTEFRIHLQNGDRTDWYPKEMLTEIYRLHRRRIVSLELR